MRIAISGSHATGKSSLVSELTRRLDGFMAIDEPYYLLEAEGQMFGSRPTSDDFELLLERSLSLVAERRPGSVLFDRSPADYLAYLVAISPGAVARDRVADVAAAMATLDLVVFVPIEHPDRVEVSEAPRLRRRVDRILREMLVDGEWAFEVPVVAVHGTREERAEQVRAKLVSEADDTNPGRVRAIMRPDRHRD